MSAERGVSTEERLRVALANLRAAGFTDEPFRRLEEALAVPDEESALSRETFGRLSPEATRRERQALQAVLVPEVGRALFGRDDEGRFWAVGRVDVGAGPWPKLGIVFPEDYPDACPLVVVFATSGAPVPLPLGLDETWVPQGGCQRVLRAAVAFLQARLAQARLGR